MMDEATAAKILALKEQGLGGRRIAAELGLSYGRVRRVLELGSPRAPLREAVPVAISPMRAVVWDIECSHLSSDLGILLCAAFLDLGTGATEVRTVTDFGHSEHKLLLWVKEQLEKADVLIGHNSTAFDLCFVNGVLARYREEPIKPRLHIDTYQVARYGFKGRASSNSLRNLAEFFGLGSQKDHMTKHQWRTAVVDEEAMKDLAAHCVRDVEVTAQLWEVMKPYFFRWRGR